VRVADADKLKPCEVQHDLSRTGAPIEQKAATAIVNLVIGIAITSLLSAVAARAVRRVGPPSGTVRQQREYTRQTEYVPTEPIDLPRSRTPGHWD
jgi:hypothetical protein